MLPTKLKLTKCPAKARKNGARKTNEAARRETFWPNGEQKTIRIASEVPRANGVNWFHNRLGIGLEIVFAIDKTLATIELPALLRLNKTRIKRSHFSVTYDKTRIESELFCGCIPLLTLIERYP